jgi:hypothetical protein
MRYVWITALVLAGVVTAVVIIGYALPVKHRAQAESVVSASPGALFGLITNVSGYPSWRSGITSAEVIPSTDGRKRFREVSRDGTMKYVIEVSEPDQRIVTRIDDRTLAFGGTWTYDLLPIADGRTTLRITEDGEVYNPVFRFVSRFIMGHDGGIKKYLADVSRKYHG